LHARARRVLVRASPDPAGAEIGTLAIGAGVRLRETTARSRRGCEGGWHAVEPEGFVCLDADTTLDAADPIVVAARAHAPDFSCAAPFRWGVSREAPLYDRVPDAAVQQRLEWGLGRHLAALAQVAASRRAGEDAPARALARLRGADPEPASAAVPSFLDAGQRSPWAARFAAAAPRARLGFVPERASLAWTYEFGAQGRSWVLTPDLLVAPKDKLAPQPASDFRGVALDGAKRLPIALIRGEPRPKYRWAVGGATAEAADATVPAGVQRALPDADGLVDDPDRAPARLEKTGETWPRLAAVALTGRARWQRGVRYLETREPRTWIAATDATVAAAQPPRGFELAPAERWIDVSIHRGTLVAYEGERAVFATLVSPGLHGYRREQGRPARGTTPTGTFRIEWKHRSTTMTPDPETMSWYLSEVPWTQFFHMPFALHAAYWHDRFGEPMSGGCVNLSVEDARWLFEWTAPSVPEGWHGVRSGGARGAGTWVRVR
jgi:hypothetical protein